MDCIPACFGSHYRHVFLSPILEDYTNYFKAGFCFIFAVIVSNSVSVPDISQYSSLASYVPYRKRAFDRAYAGFYFIFIVSNIYIAGQMIGMRIGFGMVSVFDRLLCTVL